MIGMSLPQHQLCTNIRKIYLYRVLLGLVFPVPTIVLFWQEHGLIPLLGRIADLTSIVRALQILGVITIVAGGILLLALRRVDVL